MARLGIVARREGVRELADPGREVAEGREDATHRGERTVRVDWLLEEGVVAPDVAMNEPVLGNLGFERRSSSAFRGARGIGRGRPRGTPDLPRS